MGGGGVGEVVAAGGGGESTNSTIGLITTIVTAAGGSSSTSFALPLLEGLAQQQKQQQQQQQQQSHSSKQQQQQQQRVNSSFLYRGDEGKISNERFSILSVESSRKRAIGIVEDALRYDEAVRVLQNFVRTGSNRRKSRQFLSSKQVTDDLKSSHTISTKNETQQVVSTETNSKIHVISDIDKSVILEPSKKRIKINDSTTDTLNSGSHSMKDALNDVHTNKLSAYAATSLGNSLFHSTSSTPLESRYKEHWLWRSIRAYSTAERIAAYRLLLIAATSHSEFTSTTPSFETRKSVTSSSSTTAECNTELIENEVISDIHKLRNGRPRKAALKHFMSLRVANHIVHLCNEHVLSYHPLTCRPIKHLATPSGCPPSRLAIEWIALLEHLWTLGCPAMDTKDDENLLKQQELNWVWITRSIWLCACRCASQVLHNRHQQSTAAASSAATLLSSLSHLAYVLSIRRTHRIIEGGPFSPPTSNICTTGNRLCKKSKAVKTTLVSSKTAAARRSRSDSNTSIRSTSSTSNVKKDEINTSPGLAAIENSENVLSVKEIEASLLKELRVYNSKFLWNDDNSKDPKDISIAHDDQQEGFLSPLACLIGAYFIAREFSDIGNVSSSNISGNKSTTHSTMASWFTTQDQSQKSSLSRDSGKSNSHGSGLGLAAACSTSNNAATIIGALQRSAQFLEQLVCPLTLCNVMVVNVKKPNKVTQKEKKHVKKSTRRSNDVTSKADASDRKLAVVTTTVDRKQLHKRKQRILKEVSRYRSHYKINKLEDGDDDDDDDDDDDENDDDDDIDDNEQGVIMEDVEDEGDEDIMMDAGDDEDDEADEDDDDNDNGNDCGDEVGRDHEGENISDENVCGTETFVDSATTGNKLCEAKEKKSAEKDVNPVISNENDDDNQNVATEDNDDEGECSCDDDDDEDDDEDEDNREERDNEDDGSRIPDEDDDDDNDDNDNDDDDDADSFEGSHDEEVLEGDEMCTEGVCLDELDDAPDAAEQDDDDNTVQSEDDDNEEHIMHDIQEDHAEDSHHATAIEERHSGDTAVDIDIEGDNDEDDEDDDDCDENEHGDIDPVSGDHEAEDEMEHETEVMDFEIVLGEELPQGTIDQHNQAKSNTENLSKESISKPDRSACSEDNKNDDTDSPTPNLIQRKVMYIKSCMQLLAAQYPSIPTGAIYQQSQRDNQFRNVNSFTNCQRFLSPDAEDALLGSINFAVKPPKKPLNTKIIMRRAPTQEEFFRGSLSRNPISLTSLERRNNGSASGAASRNDVGIGGDQEEPTVADLRQHIANDLQMADSAELIEIIVANKILDVNLKLRVVNQVLWKNHLIETTNNSSSSSASAAASALFSSANSGGISYFAAAGSAISMIFGSSSSERNGSSGRITKDTLTSSLPPMVITYRLAGVDGEATEDTIRVADLIDPEAPSESSSSHELEELLENEFGITRLVTEGRGVNVLLRSIQYSVYDTLRRIRRDNVCCKNGEVGDFTNPSLEKFKQKLPCNGLTLLRHCSKLASNRKRLLQARAPTILLTLLLDVLKISEESANGTTSSNTTVESVSKSNPTAETLQQLIEVLTSDISTSTSDTDQGKPSDRKSIDEDPVNDADQDVASMHLLLESIETISLSPPLRNVIAKLLPFLTYGQSDLSRELANHFNTHINIENLSAYQNSSTGSNLPTTDNSGNKRSDILMSTFVQTALILPNSRVCDTFRIELLNCAFHERLINYILQAMPSLPPPWSAALYTKEHEELLTSPSAFITLSENTYNMTTFSSDENSNPISQTRAELECAWRSYFARGGLKIAFKMLTGMCLKHQPTQAAIANNYTFIRSCHWIESTSDNTSLRVETKGLGLLAETLLDEISDGNDEVKSQVDSIRRKTRKRKKEIADSRRMLALRMMNNFGMLTGSSSPGVSSSLSSLHAKSSMSLVNDSSTNANSSTPFDSSFGMTDQFTTPSNSSLSPPLSLQNKNECLDKSSKDERPAWLVEAEMMEDESGLVCAVCQEGRTLQPSELLGLYAYVKKISIPIEQCGSRASIDGTNLFRALPSTLPESLIGSVVVEKWFSIAREAAEHASSSLSSSLTLSSSGGRRNSIFTTTVSAGNGIHISCHRKARQADRSHPKAPKSEWEGASLRNNRCTCNVILPLVSSRSSKVPLIAVDTALTDHQAAVSNLLGSSPKSMLWTVLHDVRFLILRMAYGEALNADCGGGSLASNCQLIFYQLLMADMFDQDAQVDQPQLSKQARALSAALLSGCAIITAVDGVSSASSSVASLTRGVADAAPMAALTSILFHNCKPDGASSDSFDSGTDAINPHPKREWIVGNEYFLRSFLICAGRRHALGIDGSGCQNVNRMGNRRPISFADWDVLTENELNNENEGDDVVIQHLVGISEAVSDRVEASSRKKRLRTLMSSTKPSIDDFQNVLRPILTYYAIMNQLSLEFTITADDVRIAESAQRLEETIHACQKSKNIHELLKIVNFPTSTVNHDDMIDLIQKGMVVAY